MYHFRITSLRGPLEAPGACTELRLEVDQEADELLGAVHAHTSFSQGQGGGLHGSTYSPRPLHERLRKNSSGTSGSTRKGEKREDVEQEDLADLAPDWELNDGFEWGLQASGPLEGEVRLNHNPGEHLHSCCNSNFFTINPFSHLFTAFPLDI